MQSDNAAELCSEAAALVHAALADHKMGHLDGCLGGGLAAPTWELALAVEAAGRAHGLDLQARAAGGAAIPIPPSRPGHLFALHGECMLFISTIDQPIERVTLQALDYL